MKYKLSEIEHVANRIKSVLQPDDVVGLSGTLGAGKTTLAKAIAATYGIDPQEVTSPTYVYHHIYQGDVEVHHMDLYRIENESFLMGLDLVEATERGGVTLVEWIDLFPNYFDTYMQLHIHVLDMETREIHLSFRNWDSKRMTDVKKVLS